MEHHDRHAMHHNDPQPVDYVKFAGIIIFVMAASYGYFALRDWSGWQGYFTAVMGVFFVTFGIFKLLDVRSFAASYFGYDLIASRWFAWGYVYPFIELALGVGFLLMFAPVALSILTLVLTLVGSAGILRELSKKSRIKCACLGKYVNLPLTTVSLVEDLAMAVMAAAMLVWR